MGAHRVEEVTVVAHHQHGVFKFREIVFEPCHGVEVEVVGRLVEQKVVGVAEKGLGKQHAHLLVARKVAHEHVVAVLLDAEAAQQGCGVALGVPSLELGKFFLQLRGADAVGVAEVGLGVESIFLLHDVPEHCVALEHGVDHRAVVKFEVVLLQHAHSLAGTHGHRAVGGAQLVGKYAHERGLSGTVGADDSVAVARSKF